MSVLMTDSSNSRPPVVGIFAIQGSVAEHANCIRKCGGIVKEIRLPKDFVGVDGIILPGGESTTMAIIGERWGLFPLLKEWVFEKKPIWGTCAGMILLSDHAIKKAKCGQVLVGGLDAHVCRNFFGSQIHSCLVEITIEKNTSGEISVPGSGSECEDITKCPAVFIRAPAILSIGPDVDILARIIAKPHISVRDDVLKLLNEGKSKENTVAAIIESISDMMINPDQPKTKRQRLSKNIPEFDNNYNNNADDVAGIPDSNYEVFVAVRQNHILATAFHPELTEDIRWHKYFINMIIQHRDRKDESVS